MTKERRTDTKGSNDMEGGKEGRKDVERSQMNIKRRKEGRISKEGRKEVEGKKDGYERKH
jgi:hypothetical protein